MKVLIVSTSERTGGAAVAASRLMEALKNNGVKAKMLVRDKQTDSLTVVGLTAKGKGGLLSSVMLHFVWERLVLLFHLHFKRQRLFELDIANTGTDITKLPEFKEADIIHLHWINQGMLSLSGIRRILNSGKPVVWTMHDIWPATAICHLTLDCQHYKTQCRQCPCLPGGGGRNDLAARVWKRKKAMQEGHNISYVACSRWLEGEARQSALLANQRVTSIPNPIDQRVYHATDKAEARRQLGLPAEGKLILFVSQRVTNRFKGMDYLIEACRLMKQSHSEHCGNMGVVILGGAAEEVTEQLALKAYPLGYVSDEHRLALVYSAADVFVLSSLSENLPNTIMEAMACGLPCVGFRVGGIPEEIDHRKNGYVAAYRDAADLAQGMAWVLFEADYDELCRQATAKVARCYSQSGVAMRYIEVYNQAMALNHYKL